MRAVGSTRRDPDRSFEEGACPHASIRAWRLVPEPEMRTVRLKDVEALHLRDWSVEICLEDMVALQKMRVVRK